MAYPTVSQKETNDNFYMDVIDWGMGNCNGAANTIFFLSLLNSTKEKLNVCIDNVVASIGRNWLRKSDVEGS